VKYTIKYIKSRDRHRLEYRNNGARIRQMFKTKELAKAEADRVRDDLDRAGAIWVALAASERNEIMAVIAEIKAKGLTIREVWEQFKSGQNGHQDKNKTGLEVLNELLADLKEAKVSDDYKDNLELYVKAFIKGRETMLQKEYTLAQVKLFVNSYSDNSRSTVRSRLSAWFKYGFLRGYCPGNPCELLQAVKIVRPPPRIFTLDELTKLLKWLLKRPRALAWFILSTRFGLRPGEARKTEPDMIKFKEGWIRVEAQTSKVRHRRVVEVGREALKPLKWALDNGSELPLTKQQLRDEIREMRIAIDCERWPTDITRHTAASILIAITKDSDAVAILLGTSEQKLHTNYKALMPKKEAEKLLAILNDMLERGRSLCKESRPRKALCSSSIQRVELRS
jgi:integrase